MTEWRLIRTGFKDAFTNMATDEAILNSRSKGTVPNTVRFYQWKPSAVSLGFSQQVDEEVDVESCRRLGIDIVRRPTGGGAVFHDSAGELTYSIVTGLETVPSDLISSYDYLCRGIVLGCRELGLEAQLSFDEKGRQCPNITIQGMKISGGAQTRTRKALLQHGTILLDSNLETMTEILKMGRSKACMPIEKLREKVTTLRKMLGKPVSFKEVEDCLKTGFEKALNMKLSTQDLSSNELELSSKLRFQKYTTNDWNFTR